MKVLGRVIAVLGFMVLPLLSQAAILPNLDVFRKDSPGKVGNHAGKSGNFSAILPEVMPAVVNIMVQGEITVLANPNDMAQMPDDGSGNGGENPSSPNDMSPPEQMPNDGLYPMQKRFQGEGSGVIMDTKEGYIITNAHVVNQAKDIIVTLADGRKFTAKLIGEDTLSDIAVIQIKADHLVSIPFANSNDLEVGQPVAAIGSPFGLSQTVTSGIISGLQRSNLHIEGYENFIQTDASINPGNSGGALIDTQGHLIGINTAILTPAGGNIGIGFAIPSNMARSVMLQLIEYGSVKRGLMGVLVNDVTPDLAQVFQVKSRSGALIAMVIPGSPAQKAGLKAGDIITKINGQPVRSGAEVRNTVGLLRVGATIQLYVLRDGKLMNMTIVTADPEAYQKEYAASDPFLFGLGLRDFDQVLPSQGRVQGVIVTLVERDTPAWQAGVRQGDVILSANRIPVHSLEELQKAAAKDKDGVLLNIIRQNGALFLVVK